MEERKYAPEKGAQIMQSKEEYVLDMGQKPNDAAVKDVQIKLSEEVFAGGMGFAKKGGVCIKHGGKRLCKTEGCTNQAQARGVCINHGAKHKRCNSEGCMNQAQTGGVCVKHGSNQAWREGETM